MLGLLISLLLRLAPGPNDLISGPPNPMHLMAALIARNFANSLKNSPILVIRENHPCREPITPRNFTSDRLYVVLRYSENPAALCETLYANGSPSAQPQEIITLSEASGHNYGARIAAPAKVVAVGYSFIRYPENLPRVLDWHNAEDPLYSLEGKLRVEESFPSGIELSLRSLESQPILGFRDLAAERHDMVNAVLLWLIGFFALALLASAGSLWVLVTRFRRRVPVGSHRHILKHSQPDTRIPGLEENSELAEIEVVKSERWHKRKRILSIAISFDVVLMTILALVRLTPGLTDWLSSPAHFTLALTRKFAELTAQTEGPQAPVILMEDEDNSCEPIRTARVPPQPNAIYYVLSYSEKLSLSCWTAYIVPLDGVAPSGISWVTIRADKGKNYGRKLDGSVQAIPFDRSMKLYSPEYLGLLHWRTRLNFRLPEGFVVARNYPPGNRPYDLEQPQFFNTKVGLAEIRAEVARKHNAINWLLLTGASLALLLLVVLGRLMYSLYKGLSKACRDLGSAVNWSTFMAENPDAVLDLASRNHWQHQRRLQEQVRSQDLLRRLREELENNLRSLLLTLPDEHQRERIRECLSRQVPDLEAMKSLWLELQSNGETRTPEARLNLLLDSSKEYCNQDEFERARSEAFTILARSGFREARDFAVRLHDELRARARKLEEASEEAGFPAVEDTQ